MGILNRNSPLGNTCQYICNTSYSENWNYTIYNMGVRLETLQTWFKKQKKTENVKQLKRIKRSLRETLLKWCWVFQVTFSFRNRFYTA